MAERRRICPTSKINMNRSLIKYILGTWLVAAVLPAAAQSGDEQGLIIPPSTSLPQDRQAIVEANNGWWKESRRNYAERMSWYNEAKFGCFIHWGVYSVPAGIWKGKKLGGSFNSYLKNLVITDDFFFKGTEPSLTFLNNLESYTSIADLENQIKMNLVKVDKGGFLFPFYTYIYEKETHILEIICTPNMDKTKSYFVG